MRLIRPSGRFGRVTHAAGSLAGFPLAGFILGLTSALGFIPLVLLPLIAAVGAGAVSLWRVRKIPRHLLDVGGFGRHVEAAAVVAAFALLVVAGSAVFDPDVFSLAASVTLIGGTCTAAVAAWHGVRLVRGARTLFDVTVTTGGTLSVLMLHGMFAVVPTVLAVCEWLEAVMPHLRLIADQGEIIPVSAMWDAAVTANGPELDTARPAPVDLFTRAPVTAESIFGPGWSRSRAPPRRRSSNPARRGTGRGLHRRGTR